jgi:hypothetical protein
MRGCEELALPTSDFGAADVIDGSISLGTLKCDGSGGTLVGTVEVSFDLPPDSKVLDVSGGRITKVVQLKIEYDVSVSRCGVVKVDKLAVIVPAELQAINNAIDAPPGKHATPPNGYRKSSDLMRLVNSNIPGSGPFEPAWLGKKLLEDMLKLAERLGTLFR